MTKQTHHHHQNGRCEDFKHKKDETVKQSNPFEWGVGGWWWWDQTYSVKKGKSPDKDADRQQEQQKQSGQP